MKKTTSLALSVAVLVGFGAFAKDTPQPNQFMEVLAAVPSAELPAKAADVVQRAKSRERTETTSEVVKAALGINPAAAPAVVGAIAKSTPIMASVAAGVAASEQPKQAATIAKAAAAAAPGQARKIVMTVCRAVPNGYREIALAVSQAVPTANREILSGIATAVPGLKSYIEQAMVDSAGSISSVPSVLDQAARLAQAAPAPSYTLSVAATPGTTPSVNPNSIVAGPTAPAVRGPSTGPPYIPLSTTPSNVGITNANQVPPGGRTYARP
jgi:hypothetical protein